LNNLFFISIGDDTQHFDRRCCPGDPFISLLAPELARVSLFIHAHSCRPDLELIFITGFYGLYFVTSTGLGLHGIGTRGFFGLVQRFGLLLHAKSIFGKRIT